MLSVHLIEGVNGDSDRLVVGRTSCSETAASHKAGDDCVPRILLLPPALDRTVKGREHASPYAEVSSCHRSSRFDDRDGTDEPFTLLDVSAK